MYKLHLLTITLLISLSIKAQSVNSLSSDMFDCINEFKNNITDEGVCNRQIYILDDLIDDVDELIDDTEDSFEINKLRTLKREIKAVKNYMHTVGAEQSSFQIKEDFYLANSLIGGSITEIGNFNCLTIVSVTINDYVAFIALNNKSLLQSVTIDWNYYKSSNGEIMEMGLASNSFRKFADNLDDRSKKRVTIKNTSCKSY